MENISLLLIWWQQHLSGKQMAGKLSGTKKKQYKEHFETN